MQKIYAGRRPGRTFWSGCLQGPSCHAEDGGKDLRRRNGRRDGGQADHF